MIRRRKLTIALFVVAVSNLMAAPEQAADPLGVATEQYARARRSLIADELYLTLAEAERFWPLYEQFEKDLLALTVKRRATIAKYGENSESMTDAMAKELMIDHLELEEDRHRLRRAYLPKFEKVLPVKKLARYFQIESKIQASVESGIAEELPLIK